MSMSERLRKIERRLAALESFYDQVMSEQVDDAQDAPEAPEVTLDGSASGAERDQSKSLG